MKEERLKRILKHLGSFLTFFLLVAFVVTCCMTLFLTTLAESMELEFTESNIAEAARLTMLNVIILSLLMAACDMIRRKMLVEKPAKKIIKAARRITEGDFSARVEPAKTYDSDDGFTEIAECINKMAQELSATETLRTDFIANVSHEIKTPIAVMQSYATLLSAPELDDGKRLEYARAVSMASTRLSNLVTNILKLNKLENQHISPKLESYDLSEQICECLLAFEDIWESKGIDIETDIEDGVKVLSDREMMSLVWNNLFSNALKFTEKGGKVSVSVRAEGGNAVVQVRDTGCGISKDIGKHIFDKFYQGDSSRATEGNGLGLPLVKRVIDLTRSSISVDSAVGQGSTFTVKMHLY